MVKSSFNEQSMIFNRREIWVVNVGSYKLPWAKVPGAIVEI